VTSPRPAEAAAAPPAGLDLSKNDFWALRPDQRDAGFAGLRALEKPVLFAEPEIGFPSSGEGFYALVRHADVSEASRHPELFSSALPTR
jgi:methyl-branched lipid omega-hydroxylase